MEWLKYIIKDLASSKRLVTSLWVTAVVLHFGPLFLPSYVPALNKDHIPYIFGTMILTSCLLILWLIEAFWSLWQVGVEKTGKVFADKTLSRVENNLLFLMSKNPSEPFDMETIDWSNAKSTKLEYLQAAKNLERKGLVRIHTSDADFINLTESGCQRALELQNSLRKSYEGGT